MESAEIEQNPEEIAEDLSELQSTIIQQYAHNVTLNTKQLRKATGATNGKINYHMKRSPTSLVDQGLVEFIGYDEQETTPGDAQPSQYAITGLGRDVHNVYRQREAKTEADISRVDELAENVKRLEKENQRLRERFENLKEYVSTNVS